MYTVFGTTGFAFDGEMGPYPLSNSMPPDGEMGPYPLSNSMATDGEMGPYPLSDNTNLLGSSSYGVSLYRNYGSNYGTNYTSNNYYTAKYTNTNAPSSITATTTAAAATVYRNNNECSDMCDDGTAECCYQTQCDGDGNRSKSASSKCKTPVPARRCKWERDSFRRHSAHGRISSQGITRHKLPTNNRTNAHTIFTHTHSHTNKQTHLYHTVYPPPHDGTTLNPCKNKNRTSIERRRQ